MTLNPLDWTGPAFLGFYLAAAAAIVTGFYAFIRKAEGAAEMPKLAEIDPYEIAYLRAGENEAMRIATVSLIDRGLLHAEGEVLQAKAGADGHARRGLEKAILHTFATAGAAKQIFDSPSIRAACGAYRDSLEAMSLLAGPKEHGARSAPLWISLILVLGLAGAKLALAIARGRSNVGFLIILALIAAGLLIAIAARRRTALGDRVLEDLKTLFSGLKRRASALAPGGLTNEAALLAALFGISALDAQAFPFARRLFPQAQAEGSSGSSCGSSGGGSCGGGGCGGGGCGGCGS
jgi:uncharacterized protein (TIGR04222 family)